MENEIVKQESKAPQSVREISVVTAEVKELCGQAQRMALMYAIEIGRRLVEAKSILHHGEWGEWLKNEVNFSQSSATNFMKLFEEYGDNQICLFDSENAKSQTIMNLPYTKALQLIAVPASEREEFAERIDAESISTRELEKAIRERAEAEKRAEEAERQKEQIERALSEAEKAKAEAEKKAEEVNALRNNVQNLTESLAKSSEREKKAKDKLKEAQNNPQISPEKMNEIREEAEKTANEKATAEAEKALVEARNKAHEAEEAMEQAKKRAEEAEKAVERMRNEVKMSNPEIAAFKAKFDTMQKIAGDLKAQIEKIEETDKVTAEKLKMAMKAFGGTL